MSTFDPAMPYHPLLTGSSSGNGAKHSGMH
jgi:hypothetical protein